MSSYLATILRLTPSTLFFLFPPSAWAMAVSSVSPPLSCYFGTGLADAFFVYLENLYRILPRMASQWERSRRWLEGKIGMS